MAGTFGPGAGAINAYIGEARTTGIDTGGDNAGFEREFFFDGNGVQHGCLLMLDGCYGFWVKQERVMGAFTSPLGERSTRLRVG
ncbi:hypothetical protein D3C72_2318780 [compost metagenome]